MGTIKRENRVIITKKRIAGFDRSETRLLFLPLEYCRTRTSEEMDGTLPRIAFLKIHSISNEGSNFILSSLEVGH